MALEFKLGATVFIMGPFVDIADGVTPLTGLAGTMTLKMFEASAGATSAITPTLAAATIHVADGYYRFRVTGDEYTFANAQYRYYVSNPTVHLPVWLDVQTIGDNWDMGKGDSAFLPVDVQNTDDVRDAVAAKVVETQGSITLQQALSVILAAVAGRTSNDGKTMSTPNGAATRITGTVTGTNRTGITLTPSS